MAKSQNQKAKLLYLMKYLLEKTDETHGVSAAQIMDHLESLGISCERKSLYNDLDTLRDFGLDVIKLGGRPTLYAVASREFELAELKLLVDVVQSSRFITEKKSLSLIRKLENLAGRHGARQLQRQVFVRNRIKSMNESIYYNVDKLHEAITFDKQISFRYFDYSITKEKLYRRDGARYQVSPCALTWDDENYYLIAHEAASGLVKHYRVDKMTDIRTEAQPREKNDEFDGSRLAEYAGKVFGMFAGEERTVRLRFVNHLAGAVIDRFGRDVIINSKDDGSFTVTANVVVSPQFYGWLCGFGDEVQLLWPEDVREDFKGYVKKLLEKY
ncbi:MAG: WYL domain-containing protein [Clostridiales bacterium]|nr:WYL domain-containing protein [Clostridiales bacterium]